MDRIVIAAPAKINLTLDVLGKRPDGYHELETVMHQINLHDRITLEKGEKGIRLHCSREDIPADEGNLAYKAAALFFREFPCEEGITIWIEKNIPIGAGLAGGSTDAAAVLEGLNHLFDKPFSHQRLMQLAAIIGSDIPFCLMGHHILSEGKGDDPLQGATALARGRGEQLAALENCCLDYIVLVKPEFSISTAAVYGALQMEKVQQRPDNAAFIKEWISCDMINIAQGMVNVLETVSTEMHPEIIKIKTQLRELGACNAIMSGSGPSVFGLFRDRYTAERAARVMDKCYRETFLVSSYGRSDEYAGEKAVTRKP